MGSRKKIVVTGGTGYIGSHTVVELLQANYEVYILDNLSNSEAAMVDRIEEITAERPHFIEIDLRNYDDVHAFFEGQSDISGIIHFAALKSVGESVHNPIMYYHNNVLGLVNLLKCVSAFEIPNFVFSSSCTVYGAPDKLPVTEDCPIGFTPSPYGSTKQMCERILDDFAVSNTFVKALSLRYFNPLGAHKSRVIGELPSGIPNNLMPYITQTAAGLRDYLSVFGSDYQTPDGTAIRDYIHVSDVATAHVKALEYLYKSSSSFHDKLNVGTGRGYSVLEVIQSFERTSGLKLNYKMVDRREGDIEAIYANSEKAENILNWSAKYDIDEMTKSAWEWEKKLRGVQ